MPRTEQLLVTGFADHDFGQGRSYKQISDHSLLGLEWELKADVRPTLPDHMLRPTLQILFKDTTVSIIYSAKVKLSVLLPNGQLVAEREDRVRHRFDHTYFCIDGDTHPELNNFIGQQGQLQCESFIFKADIEVHGEPTVLRSPNFDHAIELESCLDDYYSTDFDSKVHVSGYQCCSRRLVFWMITDRRVECWAVNPLVPSSQELLRLRPNHRTHKDYVSSAALSNDQHLAACVTRCDGRSYNFYVMLLNTKRMVHRCYKIQNQAEYNAGIQGLAHTRRGWIIWTETRCVYRLEKEMQLILRVETAGVPYSSVTANYNWLLQWNRDKIQIWDLGSPELSSKSYDHQLADVNRLMGHRDEIFALEGDRILSKIEFEGDECRVQFLYRFHRSSINFAFDQGKLVLVDSRSIYKDAEPMVQTVWLPGQIPTAKEMATIEIQKRTGRQRVLRTAIGARSVWKGGLSEEETRQILNVIIKPCCHQPLDII